MFCKLHVNPNKHPDLTPHIGRGGFSDCSEEEVRYTDQEYEDDTSEGEGDIDQKLVKVPFLPGKSS